MDWKPVTDEKKAFLYYPSTEEVDTFSESLLASSYGIEFTVERCSNMPIRHEFGNGPNALENQYYVFTTDAGHRFCVYWQSAMKSPAPLLINLPGYGGYVSMHPQIADDGYHIMHISPLGYVMPYGANMEMAMDDGNWPVLHNTAMGIDGNYKDWLMDCLVAIHWAKSRPDVMNDRISLFGTSQGGGGALLLASILRNEVKCVCADLPFLTAFPLTGLAGEAYGILRKAFSEMPENEFWYNIGFFDTISHAHRLTMPVMLSSGGKDIVCLPKSIQYLFDRLPATKQYSFLENNVHTHSRQSMYLFRCWLSLFA